MLSIPPPSFSIPVKSGAHRHAVLFAALGMLLLSSAAGVTQEARSRRANWKLSDKFSQDALRPLTHSSQVAPNFIGKTDEFWYSWRDAGGVTFYHVQPSEKRRKLLFDTAKMAAALSEVLKKPYDTTTLPITTVTFTEDRKKLQFTVEQTRLEWDLEKETLKSLGPARPADGAAPPNPPMGGGPPRFGGPGGDFRNLAPDKKAFVYARDHNLYFAEVGAEAQAIQLSKDGERNYSFGSRDNPTGFVGSFDDEMDAGPWDGEDDPWVEPQQRRRFGGGQNTGQTQQNTGQTQQQTGGMGGQTAPPREERVRVNASWSEDSQWFVITRIDARKVRELFLVNALAEPRPSLLSYRYALPGEENVAQVELHLFRRSDKQLQKINVARYRDQRLYNVHWTEGTRHVRFVRRDRLQRHLELCDLDPETSETRVLLSEAVDNAFLETQPVRYMKPGGDFIWWSERSGWGHLYLYSHDGTLKQQITSGPYRVDAIVDSDAAKGLVWFRGVGREVGENPYYTHLYRVKTDGKDITLLDPGDADHQSTLSTSKKYAVDTFSRVDLSPRAVLRGEDGKPLIDLAEMDLSRLREYGWKMPETFKVKAADGVTDIYGNMWKPFDFNPRQKYPIIAHVYPGPQTESVVTRFAPYSSQQRLAQLGFIVIQIGNRGGNPQRSNAFHSFGYYNLRDYGLPDKKTGIEQLAARHSFVDLDRVGIYGHSGGGFMTAAALLQPPFNTFFKVGVSSAGNHDNNIYNANWSEQHHGLKEVPVRSGMGSGQGQGMGSGGAAGSGSAQGQTQGQTQTQGQQTGVQSNETKFEIKVPANHELAGNLKGKLLLVHGDMDNNVHPGGTIRLVNALIKAGKRFDFMLLPGQAHGFGPMTDYFQRLSFEYFTEHLLGDYYRDGADLNQP